MIMRFSILLLSTMTMALILLPNSLIAQEVQEELREIDRVVAVVNDDVITKGEFDSRISALRVELDTARNGDESLSMPPEELLREQTQYVVTLRASPRDASR